MAERAKRKRAEASRSAEPTPAAIVQRLNKPPATKFIGRICRLRWPQTDKWVSAKMVGLIGAEKQTCEIEVETVGEKATAEPWVKRRINFSSQPLHIAEEVVWAPEDGEADPSHARAIAQRASGQHGLAGGYVAGLVPMVIFAPFGPSELEAEDGHVLAFSFKSSKHIWLRRESTRPLMPQMLRRRTSPALRKAVDAALALDGAMRLADTKAKKRNIIGRRLSVYWPMDDAWYSGVVQSYDAKAAQHAVLYDDGVEESIALAEEAYQLHNSPDDERAIHDYSMGGPCFFCAKSGRLLAQVARTRTLARNRALLNRTLTATATPTATSGRRRRAPHMPTRRALRVRQVRTAQSQPFIRRALGQRQWRGGRRRHRRPTAKQAGEGGRRRGGRCGRRWGRCAARGRVG